MQLKLSHMCRLQQLGIWTGTLQTGVSALARTQAGAYVIATPEQCYAMQQALHPVVSHGTAAQTTTLHTLQLNARVGNILTSKALKLLT